MKFRKHSAGTLNPKSKISVYMSKRERKHHKKKYDIRYFCINGRYVKLKVANNGSPVSVPLVFSDPAIEKELPTISDKERKKVEKARKKAKKARDKREAAEKAAILDAKRKRFKHHHGDRSDGRRLRTVNGMHRFMPYVMKKRSDAQNTYSDSFDISVAEPFCRAKVKQGMSNFSMLHVFLAAYVRVVSQRPGINRFISGQEIFARYNIEVTMTVKKTMSLDSPDTCIKVSFEPDDTIDEVYRKFNEVVEKSTGADAETGFDSITGLFQKLPRWALRAAVRLINWLDYHGRLPQALLDVSPFHGSMIITSMGSLGIKPIYHHIYDFGNLPIFISYGIKRTVMGFDRDGEITRRKYIDIKVVTDERICDGYYFASAFKLMKKLVENPAVLENKPACVYDDIL